MDKLQTEIDKLKKQQSALSTSVNNYTAAEEVTKRELKDAQEFLAAVETQIVDAKKERSRQIYNKKKAEEETAAWVKKEREVQRGLRNISLLIEEKRGVLKTINESIASGQAILEGLNKSFVDKAKTISDIDNLCKQLNTLLK